MFAIYALFLYGCGLASLGVIAHKAVPKLALTATNLLLFILGDPWGWSCSVNISLCVVHSLLDFLGVGKVRHGEIVGYFLLLTGATLGGAGLAS